MKSLDFLGDKWFNKCAYHGPADFAFYKQDHTASCTTEYLRIDCALSTHPLAVVGSVTVGRAHSIPGVMQNV